MTGFKRLGQPIGDLNNFNRFGGGNSRPGFNWIRTLTFEAGALLSVPTGFDSVTGPGFADLDVTAAAAIRGNFGYAIVIPDTNNRNARLDNLPNYTRFLLSFMFDPNSIVMGDGDVFNLIGLASPGAGGNILILFLQFTAANGYRLLSNGLDDAGANNFGAPIDLEDGAQDIEVEVQASSAPGADDGFFNVYHNGVLLSQRTGLDNDTHSVMQLLAGSTSSDAGTSGTLFIDNLRYSDQFRR